MRAIVGSSLKFRGLVVAVAAGVTILGLTQLATAPVDTLPEFSPPVVEVQTEALGLSAEEVEQLVTVPLEQDMFNGVAFLEDIESASLPGLSSIVMTFEPGTDLLDARQVVAERLTLSADIAGAQAASPPQMLQPLSSTSRVAMVRLSPDGEDGLSPIQMSVLARWVIIPRLLGVDGVANVAIWGFRDRQLQVLVDPERLQDNGVTPDQIIHTSGNALEVSPLTFLEASAPGTGGWIDTVNQRLPIFHEQAISTPQELAQVVLEDPDGNAVFVDGEPVTLGDVTDVVEDHQPLIGDAHCQQGDCLLLVIEKFPGANTPQVTRDVEAAFDAMRPGLAGMEIDTSIYRPAEYIGTSLHNLGVALLAGAILLVLVLGAFFFAWRTALVAAVATSLSLVTAALVLHLRGVTFNTMVIAGLALGLVAIIYDALPDVSNLGRRLRRHREEGGGAPAWRVIVDASMDLRRPAFYAAMIVVAAMVPLLFTEGTAGAFLPPIVLSYVVAIATSMAVALTVTPALGMMLLAQSPPASRASPLVAALQRGYDRVSSRIVASTRPAFVSVGALAAIGLLSLPFLDTSLSPALKERDILVHVDAEPGTSLPRMDELMAAAVENLSALPGVHNVGAHVGRAITSDQIVNVNSGEIWVNLDPSADYDATVAAIEAVAAGIPEVSSDVLTYSEERVTDVLVGDGQELAVRVYGENAETLRRMAEEVRDAVAAIDGVVEPTINLPTEEPTIEVEADLDRAAQSGIRPGDARRTAAVLLSGLTVGNLFEEQKVFDVVVMGTPEIRQTEDDVRQLLVDAPRGGHVPLGEVADVRTVSNPAVIRHHSSMSYLDVAMEVDDGRDTAAVAADIEAAIDQIAFPLEYHAEVLGGFADAAAARTRVLVVALTAAVGIFLLLQAAFTSWRLATLAFVTLPVALAGGAVAAWLAGGTITLGSIAGFVGVLAITTQGVVVLIQHYQQREQEEGQRFGLDLVVRATRERLGAIATSAIATAVLFAPFAVSSGAIGLEIIGPMAVVVLGGLVTATLLTVLVVPALYLRYGFVPEPDTTSEELVITIPEVDTVPGGER